MGTRANIMIEGYKIRLFKHWDGYPDGVLPVLAPAVERFWADRGYEPDMFMAYLVALFKVNDACDDTGQGKRGETVQNALSLSSYRLDTVLSSDVEYVYLIHKDGTIEVRECLETFHEKPSVQRTRIINKIELVR